eukprot:1177591-Prorocentrum_minimum.AAC.2
MRSVEFAVRGDAMRSLPEAVNSHLEAGNSQSEAVDSQSEAVDSQSEAVDSQSEAVELQSEAVNSPSQWSFDASRRMRDRDDSVAHQTSCRWQVIRRDSRVATRCGNRKRSQKIVALAGGEFVPALACFSSRGRCLSIRPRARRSRVAFPCECIKIARKQVGGELNSSVVERLNKVLTHKSTTN